MQAECILLNALIRHAIGLCKNGQRYFGACTLQYNIIGTGAGRNLANQLQFKFQIAIVGGALVTQETIWCLEENKFIAMRRGANAVTVLIVFNVDFVIEQINGTPAFLVLVEIGSHRDNRIARCSLTLGCMAIAEAGSAAKAICGIQIKEARFASKRK